MTTNEAIEYLTRCEDGLDQNFDCAVQMAISALRAQQQTEKNEPLTLEQLRRMDGEPVFVVAMPGSPKEKFYPEWCIVSIIGERGAATIGGVEHTWYDFEDYGTEWLAYRHKPEEEQE